MSALAEALADYLALRRSLGYKLERHGELLADFVGYMDHLDADHVTVEAAVTWALLGSNPDSRWRAQRLGVIRCFARYLHALDAGHVVPPPRILNGGTGRPEPYLFSDVDISALLAASRRLKTPLRALTAETVIGLLVVSGLRVAEVLRLDRADVDAEQELVRVRHSKLGRSRDVPLDPTATAAITQYLARRDELIRTASPALFVSRAGTRLASGGLRSVFAEILSLSGVGADADRAPRVGDLRHRFAVVTLLDWHRAGLDVNALLPTLSLFMGHTSPASTYWYLSAAPPLLAAAAERLPEWQAQP